MAAVTIPNSWTPKVPMTRIHWHWTAGSYTPNDTDKAAYHFLIDGNGKWIKGTPGVELNSGKTKPGYAAHTLNANTGAIGVSICCMANAKESPFDPGKYPMKPEQMAALIEGSRILGERYGIPVTRKTMLSHAEVQSTLGIPQRQKWDFTRLPFKPELVGAHAIGDWIRLQIADDIPAREPLPEGAHAVVSTNGSNLLTRSKPDGDVTGRLANGTAVVVIERDGSWLRVQTPAGYKVWVSGDYVKLVSGPPVETGTTPDPMREYIMKIRDLLDEMESKL